VKKFEAEVYLDIEGDLMVYDPFWEFMYLAEKYRFSILHYEIKYLLMRKEIFFLGKLK
jgi:hypothetical protein